MVDHTNLRQQLLRLDGQSYGAYKALRGSYEFPHFTLIVDRVQGDPFAAPSQCRVSVPQSIAAFPAALYQNRSREIALRDFLTRTFQAASSDIRQRRGSGKSGLISILQPGQAILERTSAFVNDQFVEVRFVVGLPAFGRRIAGQQAAELLCEDLPKLVDRSLKFSALNAKTLQQHVETNENADWIRDRLAHEGLVAFIANQSILPRRSGVDDRPLQANIARFLSPRSLEVSFDLPNAPFHISGLGIPKGITLIVGGGYHGKSTVLSAIARGIYNHCPQDGRELVITDPTAFKIRAEDGRSVQNVDISPFINHLPQGRSTTQFSTENASGSTSQAANILEALEAGSKVLLLDEDTCATNFMIRDRRMQTLIAKQHEPITPFIDKVRQLYTEHGVSTILVMGGCGDYLDVADTVIAMQDFQPQDVTQQAKTIAAQFQSDRTPEGGSQFGRLKPRSLPIHLLRPDDDPKADRCKAFGTETIELGRQEINVSAVEQLIEEGQLRAIAAAIVTLRQTAQSGDSLADWLDQVEQQPLETLSPSPRGDLVIFRRLELAAAINRLRFPSRK